MFGQGFGAALAIIVGSLVLGRAICDSCGGVGRWGSGRWWAAPAVGFAALIVLTGAAIKLPGRATTASVITLLVLIGAVAFIVLRRAWQFQLRKLILGGVSLLAISVPFLANGRVGLLGVGVLNDTSNHLLWAEALRSSRMAALWSAQAGYPLGPHSLVATIGTAFAIPLDQAFTGLLVAIVVILALVAGGVMRGQGAWRQVVVGLMCALSYLFIASTGEGAFKETIMALLLVAFVVHLDEAREPWLAGAGAMRVRLLIPAVFLMAGAVYTYSYVGLAWFVLTLALWIAAEAILRPGRALAAVSRENVLAASRWIGASVLVLIVLLVPVAGQVHSFFNQVGVSAASSGAIPVTSLANLIHPLSPYEGLGIWLSPDFRMDPANAFHAGELSAFALGVAIFGAIWSVRRRQLLLGAATAACFLIWWRSERTQSPYVAAKALAIGAPVVVALGLRGLLDRRQFEGLAPRAIVLTVAALFCGFALYSSYQQLRNTPVQAPEAGRELAAFGHRIGASTVLFLGDDEYARWQLRPAAVTTITGNVPIIAPTRLLPTANLSQPVQSVGQAVDFDSVVSADLDHFQYVITSNSPYASPAPPNFHLIARQRLYELWQRTGPTPPRQIVKPAGAPGAVLDCSTPAGRRIRASRGIASITATPVTATGPGFSAGATATIPLRLPPGRWELSLQYVSSFKLTVAAGGNRWTMPAYIGRPGPFFAVGAVTGHGTASPVMLTVQSERPSFLTGSADNLYSAVATVAATPIPDTQQLVPLRQACGSYVTWFRTP